MPAVWGRVLRLERPLALAVTVIVWRAGTLAADTAEFQGSTKIGEAAKIFRTKDGSIWGAAGHVPDIELFARWADEGFNQDTRPKDKFEDLAALVVSPDGACRLYDQNLRSCKLSGEWSAVGCEQDFCFGALAMGATAEQAVALAIKFCAYIGGDVTVLRVNGDGAETIKLAEREPFFVEETEAGPVPIDPLGQFHNVNVDNPEPEDWRQRRGLA